MKKAHKLVRIDPLAENLIGYLSTLSFKRAKVEIRSNDTTVLPGVKTVLGPRMKGRVVDWGITKFEMLKDPKVAKSCVVACLEEGVPLKIALDSIIKAPGVTKASRKNRAQGRKPA